jgi:hypothetical protein
VRLSPELVLVGKNGDYFPLDSGRPRGTSRPDTYTGQPGFGHTVQTSERTITARIVLKRRLDARSAKLLQHRFKTRVPWSSLSGAFRSLTRRRLRQKQQLRKRQDSAPTAEPSPDNLDTCSQGSWCVVERPVNALSGKFESQETHDPQHSNGVDCRVDVSLSGEQVTIAQANDMAATGDHLSNVPFFRHDGIPTLGPFQEPSVADDSPEFLVGKEDLVHRAWLALQAWWEMNSHLVLRQHDNSSPALLACPYWKRDAVRFHGCLLAEEFARAHDVVQHLWEKHRQPYHCPTCYETFEERSAWGAHVRRRQCTEKPLREVEGIRIDQKESLDDAADLDGTLDEAWFGVWDVTFPGLPRPASPFLDGRAGNLVALVRMFWKEHGEEMVSDFARQQNWLCWETAGEERGLRLLYGEVLDDLIDLSVRGAWDASGTATAMDAGGEVEDDAAQIGTFTDDNPPGGSSEKYK